MSGSIDFNEKPEFTYGECDQLSPLVRRIIANNPGPFTFTGTGTYLVGTGEVAVIDPGPADPEHIDAVLQATAGETISHILVTHRHVDHSPGCALLQQHTDADTWAWASDSTDGGFGLDTQFTPDHTLADGDSLSSDQWQLDCLYTPGHASDHLSFYLPAENALFCGDVVMGWSTTIVSPPDGNMAQYMASLQRLRARTDAIYYPTHGAPIEKPQTYVEQLYQHRIERENQVINCIRKGFHTIDEMVPVMYADLDRSMYPAASRSVLATIEYLVESGKLEKRGEAKAPSYHVP
jgi:glyoxylase-like metal-dependent hydrolase (beta-lactamase superfamily II)